MAISVFAWLCYGLSAGNPWIVASNLPGAGAVLASLVIMLPLIGNRGAGLLAVQSTIVGGALATLSLWTYLIFSGATAAARSAAVGTFASCIFLGESVYPRACSRGPSPGALHRPRSRSRSALLSPPLLANSQLWQLRLSRRLRRWSPSATPPLSKRHSPPRSAPTAGCGRSTGRSGARTSSYGDPTALASLSASLRSSSRWRSPRRRKGEGSGLVQDLQLGGVGVSRACAWLEAVGPCQRRASGIHVACADCMHGMQLPAIRSLY